MGDRPEALVVPTPSPILDPTDPVVKAICRYAGAVIDGTTHDLTNCNGMTLADVIAAAYENREEQYELDAERQGNILRSDRDGWPATTTVSRGIEQVITPTDTTQAWVGVWVIAPGDAPGPYDILYLTGYSYDMHGAAATFLEAWAAAVKMAFNFNDGSGTYNVEAKYQHLMDLARVQKGQARPHDVPLYRSDTGADMAEAERFFANQGGW